MQWLDNTCTSPSPFQPFPNHWNTQRRIYLNSISFILYKSSISWVSSVYIPIPFRVRSIQRTQMRNSICPWHISPRTSSNCRINEAGTNDGRTSTQWSSHSSSHFPPYGLPSVFSVDCAISRIRGASCESWVPIVQLRHCCIIIHAL